MEVHGTASPAAGDLERIEHLHLACGDERRRSPFVVGGVGRIDERLEWRHGLLVRPWGSPAGTRIGSVFHGGSPVAKEAGCQDYHILSIRRTSATWTFYHGSTSFSSLNYQHCADVRFCFKPFSEKYFSYAIIVLMYDLTSIVKKIDDCSVLFFVDTSALLETYSFSPDVFRFICECTKSFQDLLLIPATVAREFQFQNNIMFYRAKKNSSNVLNNLRNTVADATNRIKVAVNKMDELRYPDTLTIMKAVNDLKDGLEHSIKEYEDNALSISNLEDNYYKTDSYGQLVYGIIESRPFYNLPLDLVYDATEKADACKDYLGKKDRKKLGLRKYNDLLIWYEIMEYCKANKKDAFLLTRESKADWFDSNGEVKSTFKEMFSSRTNGCSIEVSNKLIDFYSEYGCQHGIKPENPTRLSLECIFEKLIASEDLERKLFEYLEGKDIGSLCSDYCFGQFEAIEDCEIDEIDFVDYSVDEFMENEKKLRCHATFKATIEAVGKTYSGHDNEDGEYYWFCSRIVFSGRFSVSVIVSENEEPVYYFLVDCLHLDNADEGDLVIDSC